MRFVREKQVYEGSSAGSMDECSFLRNRYAISEWGTKHVVQAVKRGPGNRRGEAEAALCDFLKHDQNGTTLSKTYRVSR